MFKVKISSFQRETFDWKIPGFPVMSVKLCKVRFVDGKGNHCDGVVSADKVMNTGNFICTSFCEIFIGGKEFIVLWEFEESGSSGVQVTKPVEEELEPDDNPHTLPFKVMGTCFSEERQRVLEEAYELLYKHNRPVFVEIDADPDNENDPQAIAVTLNYGHDNNYHTVGYIAKELTKYLHPVLTTLKVNVNKIKFCTTFLRIGFYITIDITKIGAWEDEVVRASKYVM